MGRTRSPLRLFLAVCIGVGVLLASALASAQVPPTTPAPAAGAYLPGRVIVKYRSQARMAERAGVRGRVSARPLRSFEFIGAELLDVGGMDVHDAIARLEADPNVEYAEPDYELHVLTVPNDPEFPQMWALR